MDKSVGTIETSSNLSIHEDRGWQETCELFLASVPDHLQQQAAWALHSLHSGGAGLRSWVAAITWRGSKLPEAVPAEIIEIYMNDEEAAPLYDCETCGIAIPVRASRTATIEDEPEYVYFDKCPVCGGRTGLYLYFSRHYSSPDLAETQRPLKPR